MERYNEYERLRLIPSDTLSHAGESTEQYAIDVKSEVDYY